MNLRQRVFSSSLAGLPQHKWPLSGPIPRDIAIVSLRYPLSRDTFLAIPAISQQGAIPPLGAFFYTDISVRYPIFLQHIARYLCDTPGKQARTNFAILSLKVSRDMKSIAAGPLRVAFVTFRAATPQEGDPVKRSLKMVKLWELPTPGTTWVLESERRKKH